MEIIRDTLIDVDPEGAAEYTANAAAYIDKLYALDAEITDTIAQIPPSQRTLVTTHDAFGYLANAYGLNIAGFVSPNPAVEPSLAERNASPKGKSVICMSRRCFLNQTLRHAHSTLGWR